MGIFSRNRATGTTAGGPGPLDNNGNATGTTTGTATGTTQRRRGGFFSGHHEKTHPHNHASSGYFNTRPSFGQRLKATWLDIVTMVCMGLVGLGVYEAHRELHFHP